MQFAMGAAGVMRTKRNGVFNEQSGIGIIDWFLIVNLGLKEQII